MCRARFIRDLQLLLVFSLRFWGRGWIVCGDVHWMKRVKEVGL